MANTTLTADVVAKMSLAVLDNEFGWIKKVHRGHQEEFTNRVNGYKIGDTVSIRKPADFTVRTGAVMNTQDVIEGKTALTVDQQIGVDFEFSSTDLTLSMTDLSERVVKPAMTNIVNHVASDVATTMYKGLYNWVGTPGNKLSSFDEFAVAPERLDEMTVPAADRCSVLSPTDHWGLVGGQTGMYVQNLAGKAYSAGSLGKIGGVDTYMSQVTPSHTVGAHGGTPLTAGADQDVLYDAVKNTWAQTLSCDGLTGSSDLLAGDVFTIAGLYMVNHKTKKSTGILQQFVINADVTTAAGGTVDLSISPPIIMSGPHQTVTNAAGDTTMADNSAITFVGTAGTSYRQNMAFHKNAMSLAIVPMEMPQGAVNGSRRSYKDFSVRVIPVYDGTNDVSKWRLDMLYGKKLIDPRLGLRLS